uniref:ABC transporter permease n=1 Tax=Prevotella sp. GTC17259 TaxID=3236795 RepID=A0AB33J8Q1_9BACT
MNIYLRQAYTMIRQHRLFSTIYIVGTALSVMLTMSVIILAYIKSASLYPYNERRQMLEITTLRIVKPGKAKDADQDVRMGRLNYRLADELKGLKGIRHVAAKTPSAKAQMSLPNNLQATTASYSYTNADFWKVFNFRFLNGKGYGEAEILRGAGDIVISESLAKRMFGTSQAAGREILFNGTLRRVAGVVVDVSSVVSEPYAEVWIPASPQMRQSSATTDGEKWLGSWHIYLSTADRQEARRTIIGYFNRVNASQKEYHIDLGTQPNTGGFDLGNGDFNYTTLILLAILVVGLLVVPSLNLSSLISSRMEKRLPEMGIRKAFGARRSTLLWQVMVENILLTAIGSAVGLLLAYAVVVLNASALKSMLTQTGDDPIITGEMLFSPWIILCTVLVCLAVNVLAAVVPGYLSLRRNIVDSLNLKK